jgi:hypothetical protein
MPVVGCTFDRSNRSLIESARVLHAMRLMSTETRCEQQKLVSKGDLNPASSWHTAFYVFWQKMSNVKLDRTLRAPLCQGFGHVEVAHGMAPLKALHTGYALLRIPAIYEGRFLGFAVRTSHGHDERVERYPISSVKLQKEIPPLASPCEKQLLPARSLDGLPYTVNTSGRTRPRSG